MGVRYPSIFVTVGSGSISTGTAGEQLALALPALNLPLDQATVFIHWHCVIPHGATAITPQFNVRRGSTTSGVLVLGGGVLTAPANNAVVQYSGVAIDANPGASQPVYGLFINNANSGTAVTFNFIQILAYAL